MICPRCQTLNTGDALFCMRCGMALTPADPIAGPPDPHAPAGAPAGWPAPQPGTTFAPSAPLTQPGQHPSYGPAGAPGYAAPPSQPMPGYITPYSQPLPGYYPPSSQPLGVPPLAPGASGPQEGIATNLFGPDAQPLTAQPTTRLQRTLMRNVSARYAVNRWFMAGAGAAVAVVVALILTAVVQSFIASAITSAVDAAAGTGSGNAVLGSWVKSFLTPDLLKLLALEHHIPLGIQVSGGAQGTSLGGSVDLTIPITALLLIPAVALTIGGYVSAASDFARAPRFSIARGALIAPFYGLLLAVLAYFGTTSVHAEVLGATLDASVGPSVPLAFVFGLLWGAIFGALGGWMQLSGRAFLSGALPAMHARLGHSLRASRIAGAIAGAVVVLVCGLMAFTALFLGVVGFGITNLATAPGRFTGSLVPGLSGATGQVLVFALLALAPALAIYGFALATGATIDTNRMDSSGFTPNAHASYGLFSGQHLVASGVPAWIYLLALLPALSYFVGGRVAAKVANARTTADGFIAGALIAVPASVLLALAANLAGAGATVSALGLSTSSTTAPSVGGTFLAVLITGAVCGGLGGVSIVGANWLGSLPRALLTPFRPLGVITARALDGFTGHPRAVPRSAARAWLYDGVLAAAVLGVAVVVLDILNNSAAATLPFIPLIRLEAIVEALLVALPLLYFTGALVTAFSTPGTVDGADFIASSNSGSQMLAASTPPAMLLGPGMAYAPPVSRPVTTWPETWASDAPTIPGQEPPTGG